MSGLQGTLFKEINLRVISGGEGKIVTNEFRFFGDALFFFAFFDFIARLGLGLGFSCVRFDRSRYSQGRLLACLCLGRSLDCLRANGHFVMNRFAVLGR